MKPSLGTTLRPHQGLVQTFSFPWDSLGPMFCEATQCIAKDFGHDPESTSVLALGVLGGILGGKLQVQAGSYLERRLSLWIAVIQEPKWEDPALILEVLDPVRRLRPGCLITQDLRVQGLARAAKESPHGILVATESLGRTFQTTPEELGLALKGWGKTSPSPTFNTPLGVIGLTNFQEVSKLLKIPLFAAMVYDLLLFHSKKEEGSSPILEPDEASPGMAIWNHMVVLAYGLRNRTLTLEKKAWEAYQGYATFLRKKNTGGQPPFSAAAAYTLRFTGILHFLDWMETDGEEPMHLTIPLDTLDRAICLVNYFLSQATALFPRLQ